MGPAAAAALSGGERRGRGSVRWGSQKGKGKYLSHRDRQVRRSNYSSTNAAAAAAAAGRHTVTNPPPPPPPVQQTAAQ